MSSTASLVTKKYSPFRDELNMGVSRAFELGLISKWSRQGLPLEAFIEPRLPLAHDTAKMTMEHLYVTLGIYGAILIVSLLVFAKELVR